MNTDLPLPPIGATYGKWVLLRYDSAYSVACFGGFGSDGDFETFETPVSVLRRDSDATLDLEATLSGWYWGLKVRQLRASANSADHPQPVDRHQRGRLHRPPGFTLLRLAEFLYSRRTYEEVLAPTVWDLQEEHMEALAAGRLWKARYVRVRGTWSFFYAAGLQTWGGLARPVVSVLRRMVP